MMNEQRKIRYAVYDVKHHEILAANYLYPGAAANHADDYIFGENLVVVKTINDKIVGQCSRKGAVLEVQRYEFLPSIWSKKTETPYKRTHKKNLQ